MKDLLLPTETRKTWEYRSGQGINRCFESNGFRVYTHTLTESTSFNTHDGSIAVPIGSLVGNWEFMPLDSSHFDPKRRTVILAKLIKGISDFFDYIAFPDESKQCNLGEPAYLYADTNPRMAAFLVRRLGFVNQPHSAKFHDEVPVAGETNIVKQKLHELKGRTVRGVSLEEGLIQRINTEIKDLPEWYSPFD